MCQTMMQDMFKYLEEMLPLSMVLDNIDAGIAIYDADGNFQFVNTKLIAWRNTPRQEYLKMNVHDFSDVLDVCVFDLVCQKKERICRLQYYKSYPAIEGPTKIRVVTGTPIFDENGNIKYVISVMQDVQSFENLVQSLLVQNKMLTVKDPQAVEPVDIIAKSPKIKQMLQIAASVAKLDSTVVLTGESGSGKEVFARYIHERSNRSAKPMITANCAAFPESLVEAELFGYEKGSFTGANQSGKVGLIEAADGSTLFLDEINSLPLSVQGKILRVLDEKSVQRIGSVKSKKVDFRLITATNQDLPRLVEQGKFREDLFYRIHVIPLRIPPIRERQEDVVPLCLHFLHYFCEKYHIKKSFSDKVLQEVGSYSWPGNVREIRNFVERMVVMTPPSTEIIWNIPQGILHEDDMQIGQQNSLAASSEATPRLSKESILAALALCNNHRSKTADYLGVSRRYLQYKIKEYHIQSRCRYDGE